MVIIKQFTKTIRVGALLDKAIAPGSVPGPGEEEDSYSRRRVSCDVLSRKSTGVIG